MAALALGFLGSQFGAIGGLIGSAVGGIIDAIIFAPKLPDGPRLDNLRVQGASYGDSVNRVYGTVRVPGTVVWAPPLIERTKRVGKSLLNKGQKVYEYDANFAILVCEGAAAVVRIWADSKLVYDASGTGRPVVSKARAVRIYNGSEDQSPDTLIQSYEGAGSTPAYRGMTYVVFERLQLKDFGNRIPNLSFEVSAGGINFDLSVKSKGYAPSISWYVGAPVPMSSGSVWAFRYDPEDLSHEGGTLAERFVQVGSSLVVNRTEKISGISIRSQLVSSDGRYVVIEGNSNTKLAVFDTSSGKWLQNIYTGYNFVLDMDQSAFFNDGRLFVRTLSTVMVFEITGNGLVHITTSSAMSGLMVNNTGIGNLILSSTNVSGVPHLRTQLLGINGSGNPAQTGPVCPLIGEDTYLQYPAQAIGLGNERFMLMWTNNNGTFWYQVYRVNAFGAVSSDSPLLEVPPTYFGSDIYDNYSTAGAITKIRDGLVAAVGDAWVSSQQRRSYYEILAGAGVCSLAKAMVIPDPLALNPGSPGIDYGNRISSKDGRFYTQSGAEVAAYSAYAETKSVSLAHILRTEFLRSGLTEADFNVSDLENVEVWGMPINQPSSARQIAEILALYKPFDLVESSGLIKSVTRKNTVDVEVERGWTALAAPGSQADPYEVDRTPETDLPKKLSIQHLDVDRDYQQGVQHSFRTATTSTEQLNVSMPLCVSGQTAVRVAEERLYTVVNERELERFSVPREFILLDPGDVVGFRGRPLRVSRGTQVGQHLELEAVPVYLPAYNSNAVGPDKPPPTPPLLPTSHTALGLYALPALAAEYASEPGFYFTVEPSIAGAPWPGADILRTPNHGATWEEVTSSGDRAVIGTVEGNPLPAGPADMFDEGNVVRVKIRGGTLESVSAEAILEGSVNLALIGNELIQFREAAIVASGEYELKGLLRGRFGTDDQIGLHVSNERFVLLTEDTLNFQPLPFSDTTRNYGWAAVTDGLSILDADVTNAVLGRDTLVPYAPVLLNALRNGSGDIAMSWHRRARSGGGWWDSVDVPLDEAAESYEIEVLNASGTPIRTLASSQPSIVYTASQQASDGNAGVRWRVFQISARVGRGKPATGVL